MNILAKNRQNKLLDIVKESETVSISDAALLFSVSEMTIRRDLKELQNNGLLDRVHGGAVASGTLKWKDRLSENKKEKLIAVKKFIDYIPDAGCIYIDASTTTFALIDYLKNKNGLTVVTNNIDTFQKLASHKEFKSLLVGGDLNHETDNLIGTLARQSILQLSFDVSFFSAYALNNETGLSEPSLEDAEIKQLVTDRSNLSCVAISSDKIGKSAAGVWTAKKDKNILATELKPNDSILKPIKKIFTKVI